jgi:hypothetical protein
MGVVQDGWEFVAAAYILTAVVLGAYGTSIFLRYRAAKARTEKQP